MGQLKMMKEQNYLQIYISAIVRPNFASLPDTHYLGICSSMRDMAGTNITGSLTLIPTEGAVRAVKSLGALRDYLWDRLPIAGYSWDWNWLTDISFTAHIIEKEEEDD